LGVQFYQYQKGFLHQKAYLIDDDFVSIGTANLDHRSFRLNFEIQALFPDRELARFFEAQFQKDFEDSKELHSEEVETRHRWSPLLIRLSRLLSPVL